MLKENIFMLRNLVGQIRTFAHGCQVILDSGVSIEYLGCLFASVTRILMRLDEDVIRYRNYLAKYSESLADAETFTDEKSPVSTELCRLLQTVDYLRDTLITAGQTLLSDPVRLVTSHMEDNCIVDDALNIDIRQFYFVASRCHRVESSLSVLLNLLSEQSAANQTTNEDDSYIQKLTPSRAQELQTLINALNGLPR